MTTPFPYGRGPLTKAEQEANREACYAALKRADAPDAEAIDTRGAILNLMGAWSEGIMADSGLMALLDRHEANLRRAWENAEKGFAQQRAEDAIRGALRAGMAGQLL
jgi:hypothetical protein